MSEQKDLELRKTICELEYWQKLALPYIEELFDLKIKERQNNKGLRVYPESWDLELQRLIRIGRNYRKALLNNKIELK